MKECSKALARRLADSRFLRRYFRGAGLDVGGGHDPLALYAEFFPLVTSIQTWDRGDGDAQHLPGVADESYDFVHSSHCLEHLLDPFQGLASWFRVLKQGGYLVVTVPDEDLYEQGKFPSTFNADHKHTFSICKTKSWSPRSINVTALLARLGDRAAVERIELLDDTYRLSLPRYDQTATPVAECGIEFVVRKRAHGETGESWRRMPAQQPRRDVRMILNQYRSDHDQLKLNNGNMPPYTDEGEIK